MSYQVLARKWRPQGFSELVGQQHVVKALSHALTSQRLHHAYLFTGTRGVGKTTLSRILAKSLNCETGITATPCGQCSACLDIDAGVFTDYIEMDAASHRGVDDMSALLDRAAYAPVRGRYKIYMIDEVHMLSNTAFNAMLKTLEEPPEYLKFILATTDPQKIPVTVLSRCLQFVLKPMTVTQISDYLTTVLLAEHIHSEPLALSAIAKAAQGSMRDALSILDQAIAHGSGQVLAESVHQMLGIADTSGIYTLMQYLARRDMPAALTHAEQLLDAGIPTSNILDEIANIASRLAIYEQGYTKKTVHTQLIEPALQQLLHQFTPEYLQLMYGIATKAQADIAYAPNDYAALAMPLLRMQIFAPNTQTAAIPQTPTLTATPPQSKPSNSTQVPIKPLSAVVTTPIDTPMQEAGDDSTPNTTGLFTLTHPEQWPSVANSLPLTALARMTARESACSRIDGLNVYLMLSSKQMADSKLVARVQESLRTVSGLDYVLHVNVVDKKDSSDSMLNQTAVAHAAAEQAQRQSNAEQSFEHDPLVKRLVALGGQVVTGSVVPLNSAPT
jgi:DNA polymerase III subunit gamma/tau